MNVEQKSRRFDFKKMRENGYAMNTIEDFESKKREILGVGDSNFEGDYTHWEHYDGSVEGALIFEDTESISRIKKQHEVKLNVLNKVYSIHVFSDLSDLRRVLESETSIENFVFELHMKQNSNVKKLSAQGAVRRGVLGMFPLPENLESLQESLRRLRLDLLKFRGGDYFENLELVDGQWTIHEKSFERHLIKNGMLMIASGADELERLRQSMDLIAMIEKSSGITREQLIRSSEGGLIERILQNGKVQIIPARRWIFKGELRPVSLRSKD